VILVLVSIALSSCAGVVTSAAKGNGGSGSGSGAGSGSGSSPSGVATLSASATSLNCGSVAVGSSASQSVTITNIGTTSASITQAPVSGAGFSLVGSNLPATMAAGASATVQIQFAPTTDGAAAGSYSIASDATNSPVAIALSGMGTTTGFGVTPGSISFGSVAVGSNNLKTVTVTNTGNTSVSIQLVTPSGTGFSVSGISTPMSVASGSSATFNAVFAPSAAGSMTGSISVTANAAGSPATIALTGSAVQSQSQLTVSSSSVTFGSVNVGGSSSQNITLTNSGNAALNITSATASGTGFSINGIGAQTINAGASTTFAAQFAPTAAGSDSGSISIVSNAPNSPAAIALSATAVQTQPGLTLSATSEAFGSVSVGSSASKSITVTNSGNAALTISSATASGAGFSISGLGSQTINAGASTSFTALFAPSTAGTDTGSISIVSNAPNSPSTITLSATAIQTQPILLSSSSNLSFGNVNVGASSSQNITLSNTGTAALTIMSATATGTGFSISGIGAQTINAGASTTFAVQFAPTAAGNDTGNISIVTNAAGSPMNIPLTGSGAQGVLGVSPTSVGFGSVAVGSNGSKSLTLTNSGTASITVSSASATGAGFGLSGLTTPVTVSVGQSVPFSASFTPVTSGAVSGTITLGGSGSSFSLTVPLTGTGTQPQFSATPASASFGSVTVGNSNSQTITLSNSGNATLTISSATVSGAAFSMSSMSTPTTIAAGGTAQFNVVFTPTASSAVTGTISLVSNAPNSPLTIALTGTGTSASQLLSASPTTLSFGNVNDGTTSSLSVTLTNSGNADITISGVTTTGSGFSTSGGSGVTLSANQTTTVSVAFDPSTAGAVSGKVSVASNATNSPAVITVTGTGVASSTGITVSPTSLSFGSQTVNTTAGANTVTVTNTGTTSITVSSVSTSAPFAVSGFSGSTTLTANQALSLSVTFDPTSQISSSGTLTITSSAPSSPNTVALSGTGVAVTQTGTPDLTPPICGLTSNTSNIIPNATTWANFTPPAVGSTYTDSAYGCAVTRLTNASSDPGGVGEVHYYSLSNPLSAADTKVLIFDQNGNWHVVDTNGTVVVSTSNFGPGQGIPVWDVTNDNVFWRASGSTLEECTIDSSAHTVSCVTNHTFSEYGYMVNIPDKGDMSPGGWINMLGQSSQGGSFDMFMYNPATGTKSPTFTEGSCDGDINDSEPGCLHSTTVFVGENMTADFESGTPSAAGIFWAAPFNASSFNTVDQGDHNDEGVYTDGTTIVGVFEDYQPNPGPWGNCTHSYRPTIVTYSATGAAVGSPSCMFDNMPSEPGWWVSYRDSVNRSWVAYSTQATSSAEYFNSDSSYAAPSSSNWLMYTGEILLVRADANNNPSLIYRLTLTHSRQQESGAYWAGPRAALSRSGNYVVFDSNAAWGQNGCGSISTCTDVYIIKLH
jgi:hypothetical protein